MARPALHIEITRKDQKNLKKLLSGGVQQVRVVLRAMALLQMAKGVSAPRIAGVVPLTPQAIRRVAHRYEEGGLERALYEKERPGAATVLEDSRKQGIIAMVCSDPAGGLRPVDRATCRRGSREAAPDSASGKRNYPGSAPPPRPQAVAGKKCGAWPNSLNQEYVEKMEDVLGTYEQPYNPQEPVVCLDEKPVTLHAEVRPASPARPGREARRDSDYERCGTANVFCAVEPKAGRHFTFPTPDRSGFEFAQVVLELALQYPQAKTIHLVMDNLNIHRLQPLTDLLGAEIGSEVWDRFTVHYTPTHGSWLNQAEIEIGLFSRQCLGKRRIPDLHTLRREARAWNRRMNRTRVKINRKFTRKAARRKFGYKRKSFKRS